MRQIKEEWRLEKRDAFENHLLNLGWRPSISGTFFSKNNLTIETDPWGIWLYEDGNRLFGLADNYVDDMIFDHLGPLVQNPFANKKRYLWLNLVTGGYATQRSVRKNNEQQR